MCAAAAGADGSGLGGKVQHHHHIEPLCPFGHGFSLPLVKHEHGGRCLSAVTAKMYGLPVAVLLFFALVMKTQH